MSSLASNNGFKRTFRHSHFNVVTFFLPFFVTFSLFLLKKNHILYHLLWPDFLNLGLNFVTVFTTAIKSPIITWKDRPAFQNHWLMSKKFNGMSQGGILKLELTGHNSKCVHDCFQPSRACAIMSQFELLGSTIRPRPGSFHLYVAKMPASSSRPELNCQLDYQRNKLGLLQS